MDLLTVLTMVGIFTSICNIKYRNCNPYGFYKFQYGFCKKTIYIPEKNLVVDFERSFEF